MAWTATPDKARSAAIKAEAKSLFIRLSKPNPKLTLNSSFAQVSTREKTMGQSDQGVERPAMSALGQKPTFGLKIPPKMLALADDVLV
jgi:hypothetical protein